MKIILIRHGRPDINTTDTLSAQAMAQWIEQYDNAEVSEQPPASVLAHLPTEGDVVVASDLPRALASLNMTGITPDRVDSLYREAQLPSFALPALRLSPLTYAALFRLLWLAGFSNGVESFAAARLRAQSAADTLIELARTASPVSLMGHGVMNRLIGKQLEKQGFIKTTTAGKSYWALTVYEKG